MCIRDSPSYVLGGQNMIVAYTKADVIEYMGVITEHVDMDHPVPVSYTHLIAHACSLL